MITLPDRDYIVGFKSQNVQHIADFELTLAKEFKSFIVLTGENGAGKTWLLEHVFKAINQRIHVTTKHNGTKGLFTVRAIEQGDLVDLSYTIQKDNSELLRGIHNLSFKLAVYSANRLRIHSEQSTASNMRKDYFGENSFDSDRLLRNGEYWLKMKLLAGRKDLVQEGMNVLKSLMPNVIKVDYRQDAQEGVIFQYHTEYGIESIQTISAGNKVILALIGDLFSRLWDNQLEIKQAKDLTGIVFIDEIEAHLHPNWQRKFPQLLAQTFPKVQFVVSTHTPMTILGLPKNSVLLHVDNNEDGEITVEQLELDFWNMLPQQILTSPVFGLESLRSVYNETLEELHTEDNYAELLENKKVKDNINEWSKRFKAKKSDEE